MPAIARQQRPGIDRPQLHARGSQELRRIDGATLAAIDNVSVSVPLVEGVLVACTEIGD